MVQPGDRVDMTTLIMAHNENVRVIESLRLQVGDLITQNREAIGRIDVLEGLPNSTMGDAKGALTRRLAVVESALNVKEAVRA